jgi:hypothetical protein
MALVIKAVTMRNEFQDELYSWLRFIGRRILEGLALTAWCFLAWAFHEYIVKKFPLDNKAELTVHISEYILNAAAIIQLIRLLFSRRRRAMATPWWR